MLNWCLIAQELTTTKHRGTGRDKGYQAYIASGRRGACLARAPSPVAVLGQYISYTTSRAVYFSQCACNLRHRVTFGASDCDEAAWEARSSLGRQEEAIRKCFKGGGNIVKIDAEKQLSSGCMFFYFKI